MMASKGRRQTLADMLDQEDLPVESSPEPDVEVASEPATTQEPEALVEEDDFRNAAASPAVDTNDERTLTHTVPELVAMLAERGIAATPVHMHHFNWGRYGHSLAMLDNNGHVTFNDSQMCKMNDKRVCWKFVGIDPEALEELMND